ncbi:DUF5995 family protein [Mycolicibacterium lacusdiani]|uniref:DUF5995 family protein n=1 Tax=Mycolicibacterium lacusdiani TaxID=2895283 RepID=UPI001F3D90CB|nr:DUF5995 family protein [Mycolicibacterium lacusdiani]
MSSKKSKKSKKKTKAKRAENADARVPDQPLPQALGPVFANPPADRPLPWLSRPTDVQSVIRQVDDIVDWSIEIPNGIGYFATMQKRIAIAVELAIEGGEFDDADRMRELTLIFVGRYFDALNAYFHPEPYQRPTKVWQWAFDGVSYDEPIIVQHLLTGICAHIMHDLGIAAARVGGNALPDLEHDFDYVNVILASQVKPVLAALTELSPVLGWLLSRVAVDSIVAEWIVKFRDLAWAWAGLLVEKPDQHRDLADIQDAWASVMSVFFLNPTIGPMPSVVRCIARSESRDIARNVRRFDDAAQTPVPADPVFVQALMR